MKKEDRGYRRRGVNEGHRIARRPLSLEPLEPRLVLAAASKVFSPTLVVGLHGQTTCTSPTATVGKIVAEAATQITSRARGASVQQLVVQWDTCGAIGDQPNAIADQIQQLTASGGKWDLMIYGYSRGAIFANELVKRIETRPQLKSQLDYIQTILLDPTAARTFGDEFPKSKSSVVDYQLYLDDDLSIAESTGVVAGAGCAVGAILGGLAGGLVGASAGCVFGAGIAAGADLVAKAFGGNVQDIAVSDNHLISNSTYRNVYDSVVDQFDLDPNSPKHSLEVHSNVASWYLSSDDLATDVNRFLGYKDIGVSVATITNNLSKRFELEYRWGPGEPWEREFISAGQSLILYNRVYDNSVEVRYQRQPESDQGIARHSLRARRHYGSTNPEANDGSQYLVQNDGTRFRIVADEQLPDLIGVATQSLLSNSAPLGNQPFSISVPVRNAGSTTSAEGKVDFYAFDGSQFFFIGSDTFSAITPGSQRTAGWTGTIPRSIPFGNYLVTWEIYEVGGVEEQTVNNTGTVLSGDRVSFAGLTVNDAAPSADEPNDSIAAATFLIEGGLARELHNPARLRKSLAASIHQAGDIDWYRIELLSWSGPQSYLRLTSPNGIDGVQVALVDAQGNSLAAGVRRGNVVDLDLGQYPRGTYYVQVSATRNELNYDLEMLMRERSYPTDGLEPNNRTFEATPLASDLLPGGWTQRGSIETPGDVDWYRLHTTDWAAPGSFIDLTTISQHGRIGVWLATLEGQVRIVPETLLQGASTRQRLDLTHLPPGEYFIGVAADWAVNDQATWSNYYDVGPYDLAVKVTALGTHQDRYEPNDTFANSVRVAGNLTYRLDANWIDNGIPDRRVQPTLHAETDEDWFVFELPGHGQPGDFVQLTSKTPNIVASAAMTLEIYSSAGVLLGAGRAIPDGSLILSLDGLRPSAYHLRVASTTGGTRVYDLLIDAVGIPDDAYEPNGSSTTATPLPGPFGKITSLTIPTSEDHDWFQFNLSSVGKTANTIRLEYQKNHPEYRLDGVLQMDLFDAESRLVASTSNEVLSLAGLMPGNYSVRVSGRRGATNVYSLHYDCLTEQRLPAIIQDDGFPLVRLTYGPEGDAVPLIDETLVAWLSESGNFDELMMLDLGIPEPRARKLSSGREVASFHVADGWIVWSENDGNDFEIFVFDGVTTRQITDNQTNDFTPRVSKQQIVWQGASPLSSFNREIFTWIEGETRQLSFNVWNDELPQISEGVIAWMGWDGRDSEIFIHRDGNTEQISFNTVDDWLGDTGCTGAFSGCRPIQQLDAERLVWHSGGAGSDTVQYYDGEEVHLIFEGSAVFPPVLQNGLIAFQAFGGDDLFRVTDEDGETLFWGADGDTYQVFVYEHEKSRSMRQLTVATEPGDLAESPWIEGNVVYWAESIRGGPTEIFLYDGIDTRQLTDNNYYEYQFVSSYGQIVWTDGSYDINGEVLLLQVAPRKLLLEADLAVVAEDSQELRLTITRENTDTHNPLVVQLYADLPDQLLLPDPVVIPAGKSSVTVVAKTIDNELLDGRRLLSIVAQATGFNFGSAEVEIIDREPLQLALNSSSRSFREDLSLPLDFILTRPFSQTESVLEVHLTANDPLVEIPASVQFPAGIAEITVPVQVTEQLGTEDVRNVRVTAAAVGYVSAEEQFELRDAERLILTADREQGAEGETLEFILRRRDASLPLAVGIVTSTDRLVVESTLVQFASGEYEIRVPVTIAADSVIHPPMTASVWAVAEGIGSNRMEVEVLDPEIPQIISTEEHLTARQFALGHAYAFQLSSRPTESVVLQWTSPEGMWIEPQQVVINPDVWMIPHTIQMGLMPGTQLPGGTSQWPIQTSVTSQDPIFGSLAPAFFHITVTNTTPLQNPFDAIDVNADGSINPADALMVLNYLNRGQGGSAGNAAGSPLRYYDVNGDNEIKPIDALIVINFLNRRSQARSSAVPDRVQLSIAGAADGFRSRSLAGAHSSSFREPTLTSPLSVDELWSRAEFVDTLVDLEPLQKVD